VVKLRQRTCVPGGAANTAANVAGLAADVVLAGVVGADEAAGRLREALAERGIGSDGLLVDQGRPTTTKMRVLAQNQQIVRVDHEQVGPLPAELEERLLAFIEERMPEVDACLVSDYAKGVVSARLAQRVIQRATALGKPVLVDPKGSEGSKYRGATLVKPNLHEAGVLLRRQVDADDVEQAGRALLDKLGTRCVLLTRGEAGMSLFEQGAQPVHVQAQAREVYDVTGAGDTVAATLTVALAAGAGFEQAARLANRAAGIIVGRVGTTAVSLDELLDRQG
jgi:D-beta-D-heptose 7-phosphate kinase/D-beta-D-heptose 1-phosphate adenosyltransferase